MFLTTLKAIPRNCRQQFPLPKPAPFSRFLHHLLKTSSNPLPNPASPENPTHFRPHCPLSRHPPPTLSRQNTRNFSSSPPHLDTSLPNAASLLIQKGDIAAAGMSLYTPSGIVRTFLESLCVNFDMTWFGSIVAGTLLARLLLFPLIVKVTRNNILLSNIRPEMHEMTAKLNAYQKAGNSAHAANMAKKLQGLFSKNNCHPLTSLLGPLLQMPIFISFFFAIRSLATLPLESMKSSGVLWFPDLTAADPYFILPIAASLSMLAVVELGVDGNPQTAWMKTAMRVVSVTMIPFTLTFPSGIFVYWITTNSFSVGQTLLFQNGRVKRFFDIPDAKIAALPASSEPPAGFWESMKSSFQAERDRHEMGLKGDSKGEVYFSENPTKKKKTLVSPVDLLTPTSSSTSSSSTNT